MQKSKAIKQKKYKVSPYLTASYGEKVKAYLIRGARHLPGYEVWPNPQLGWGTLCVRDSLPL